MLAHPEVGDAYRQEYYEGEAEDMGEVLEVGATKELGLGSYDDVLVTEDWNPLEPEVIEEKSYAPGVGLIFEAKVAGGEGESELIEFTPAARPSQVRFRPVRASLGADRGEEQTMRRRTKVLIAGARRGRGRPRRGRLRGGRWRRRRRHRHADHRVRALDKASAAALEHTGEGRVTETEVGDEESYYEVEVTLDDGSQVDVQLDEQFNVVGDEADDDVGGDDD